MSDHTHTIGDLAAVTALARNIATEYGHGTYSAPHLMRALMEKQFGLVPMMDRMAKDVGFIREWCDVRIETYPKAPAPQSNPAPDDLVDTVLREAEMIGLQSGKTQGDLLAVLAALCTPGVGFSFEQLKSFPLTRADVLGMMGGDGGAADGGAPSPAQAAGTASAGPAPAADLGAIQAYCHDKTELAKQGKIDPIIGRDKEVRMISEILGRRSKPNVIIVGDPGVGKTALVDGFALDIVADNVPAHLKNATLLELDLGSLVAGASYKGEVEDRIKKVVAAVKSMDKAVLFIDEVHALMDENRGLSGCANLIKPELARGELTVIGATTHDEYREFLEPEEAFMRRFELVQVDEPNDQVAFKMLNAVAPLYADHHELSVTEEGLKESIRLARRYLKERRLPDAAIDLVDRTMAAIRMMNDTTSEALTQMEERFQAIVAESDNLEQDLRYFHFELSHKISPIILGKLEDETEADKIDDVAELQQWIGSTIQSLMPFAEVQTSEVGKEDIASIVSHRTGIPIGKVQSQERERLLNMEETLKSRVIGQDHAITMLADSILESRSGLNKPNLPTGSFFFLGPTGTGKTELAKALAEFLFADENSLIRFDMSEFKEEHSAALLYGAPPGYVGYKEGGLLVNKIRQQPYAIVLFDEIEKAHPSVFDLFLQILDEGKLHDRLGKEGDFSNAVILFTSNIGSDHIIDEFSKGHIPKSADLLEIMSHHFRPEFLARLTEILPFRPISEDTVEFIFKLQLKDLVKALDKQGISLELTPEVVSKLAMEGFTPKYGARPLRGVIRNRLRRPISRMIISGEVSKNQEIAVSLDGDGLKFDINSRKPIEA